MPGLLPASAADRLLADPSGWARTLYRASILTSPVVITAYGVWYDALAARESPDLAQLLSFVAAGLTLWAARRCPWLTAAAALTCWHITESCVFVIALSFVLGLRRPRGWLVLLGLLAAVHPLGLVPDPCAYRAGHTTLAPETAPLFAVVLPALIGTVILTSRRLAASREARLLLEAESAESRARALITADRMSLSRDMHDLLGRRVSRMVLHATAISATTEDGRTSDLAARISDIGVTTIDDLHYIVGVLRTQTSPGVPKSSAAPTARTSLEDARRDGMTVEVHGVDHLDALAPRISALADAVIAEALHNTAKHASGAAVAVLIDIRDGRLSLRVENGPGSSPVGHRLRIGGHGLSDLRGDAATLRGSLHAGATDDDGFLVELEVPL